MALLTGYHLCGVGVAGFLFIASARVWGKRHLYILGTIFIIISSAWGGASKTNYQSLLWARIIQGVGLAPFEALVNASVGDLYFVHVGHPLRDSTRENADNVKGKRQAHGCFQLRHIRWRFLHARPCWKDHSYDWLAMDVLPYRHLLRGHASIYHFLLPGDRLPPRQCPQHRHSRRTRRTITTDQPDANWRS